MEVWAPLKCNIDINLDPGLGSVQQEAWFERIRVTIQTLNNLGYLIDSFIAKSTDLKCCHNTKHKELNPVMFDRVNLYIVLYWWGWSMDFKCRCQCQFNSYVKNSKLCNNLTYKGFIATQKLTFISSSASWCCVNKAAAHLLSYCTHSVNVSLLLLLSVSAIFVNWRFFLFCE